MSKFAGADGIEFRLLGPVEVRVGGRLLDTGTPKRRLILATLLVDAGHVLTLESLMDRVWNQNPPPQARAVLYAHLSRIRQLLRRLDGPGGAEVALQRRSGGYAIQIDPGLVDLHRARRLVEQARRPGSDLQRAVTLHEALQLWRGEPLSALPGDWAARTRQMLRQQHVDTVLAWADAELRLGRADVVIETLHPLIDEHPTVEPLPVLLMSALYAAGRGAEALGCFDRTQRRLSAELGADPGPELRALHRAILRGEVELPPVPAGSVPVSNWLSRPRR